MSAPTIQALAERLRTSDPSDSRAQREIYERIRELRSAFDGPLDPESHRCLEASGMLVAYLARMGTLAGDDVRTIAVRLLMAAADFESGAAGGAPRRAAPDAPSAVPPVAVAYPFASIEPVAPAAPVAPVVQPDRSPLAPAASRSFLAANAPPNEPPPATVEQDAIELMGDMILGQILLQRGHVFEEHIHQAIKVQKTTSMRIGDVFVKIGACSRAQVADALQYQSQLRRLRESLPPPPHMPSKAGADTRGTGLKIVGEVLLGEILIERNVISRRQLERALEVQKQTGSRIGEALVKIGATTLEQIEQALRIQGRDRRFSAREAGKRAEG
jgi:hypothetical protein